jgi:hypothetical protein
MAFENTKAEIAMLMSALQAAPEDQHELYLEIMQKLNELKAYGMPLPDDLVELEHSLERVFAAELCGDAKGPQQRKGRGGERPKS